MAEQLEQAGAWENLCEDFEQEPLFDHPLLMIPRPGGILFRRPPLRPHILQVPASSAGARIAQSLLWLIWWPLEILIVLATIPSQKNSLFLNLETGDVEFRFRTFFSTDRDEIEARPLSSSIIKRRAEEDEPSFCIELRSEDGPGRMILVDHWSIVDLHAVNQVLGAFIGRARPDPAVIDGARRDSGRVLFREESEPEITPDPRWLRLYFTRSGKAKITATLPRHVYVLAVVVIGIFMLATRADWRILLVLVPLMGAGYAAWLLFRKEVSFDARRGHIRVRGEDIERQVLPDPILFTDVTGLELEPMGKDEVVNAQMFLDIEVDGKAQRVLLMQHSEIRIMVREAIALSDYMDVPIRDEANLVAVYTADENQ
jgi:hypothetical protein